MTPVGWTFVGHILEVANECPLPTTSTHSMHPRGPVSSYGRCGMTKLWNHLSKQALDKKMRCLVRAKRQSQRDVLRGAMRWLFHERTMSRRCSASKRPVKSELNLAMTASQNGVLYRRGFPKAQKFGAKWLSIMMINELNVPANDLWKYVDDTTISETISKNQDSHIQAAVDTLVNPRFLGKVSTKRDEMQGTVDKL